VLYSISAALFMHQRQLEELRKLYPDLIEDLQEGIYLGEADVTKKPKSGHKAYALQKAEAMKVMLNQVIPQVEKELEIANLKITKIRNSRLISQVLILLGSSSVLGSVTILHDNTVSIASAVITLFAAFFNLFAENSENLLNPQSGNIYLAYQRLSEGLCETRILESEIGVAITYCSDENEFNVLTSKANNLFSELNKWLIQLRSRTSKIRKK
jgi:hypothetical protein